MSEDKLLSMLDKYEYVKETKTIRDRRKENLDSDKILRELIMNQKRIIKNQQEPVTFLITIVLNMRVMGIKIKSYQLRNILT